LRDISGKVVNGDNEKRRDSQESRRPACSPATGSIHAITMADTLRCYRGGNKLPTLENPRFSSRARARGTKVDNSPRLSVRRRATLRGRIQLRRTQCVERRALSESTFSTLSPLARGFCSRSRSPSLASGSVLFFSTLNFIPRIRFRRVPACKISTSGCQSDVTRTAGPGCAHQF